MGAGVIHALSHIAYEKKKHSVLLLRQMSSRNPPWAMVLINLYVQNKNKKKKNRKEKHN